jgi:hypothetical protein
MHKVAIPVVAAAVIEMPNDRRRPMRRTLVAAVGVIGLVIVTGLSASAVAAPKGPTKRAFTETSTGALISIKGLSFEGVFKVTSSADGTGAGIEDGSVTASAFPLSGKNTLAEYFADGVQKLKETYKLGAPNANGTSTITGSGKCVGGTGVHKKEKCTYTVTGTTNSKTNVDTVKVTGTYRR